MKKKILLMSALGAAGGLLYVLGSQHKRNKTGQEDDESAVSGNGQSNAKAEGAEKSRASSMKKIEDSAAGEPEGEHVIDDQGTGQSEASEILKSIRDRAFDASNEKLALALGRPTEEIEEWTGGNGLIDGDIVMKARNLAMQRGFEI